MSESLFVTHVADPLSEVGGAREHGGFLQGVASQRGDEAGHPLNVPATVPALAVQRTPGVALHKHTVKNEAAD